MPRPLLLRAALFGGVLGVSSASILIRFLSDHGANTVAAYRMLYAALLLSPFAIRGSRRARSAIKRHSGWFLAAASLLALHFATFTRAVFELEVARATLLVASQPMFVVAGSFWCLHERASGRELLALGVALAGLLVLLGKTAFQSGNAVGDVLGLVSAISFAGYLLVSRKLRQTLQLSFYAAPLFGAAALLLFVAAAVQGEKVLPHEGTTHLKLLALAVFPTLGGHFVFQWTIRFLPSNAVATAFVGEPAVAGLLAWLLFAETPSSNTLFGGLLCLGGVIGIVLSVKQSSRPPAPGSTRSATE